MQLEKQTITHLAANKYFKWFYQKNVKDVEFERIDDKTIKLSTDLIKDEIFTKTPVYKVFLYKYLFVFLIAVAFLVELDFSLGYRSADGNIPLIVAIATILNSFLLSSVSFINTTSRNIEKKLLVLVLFLINGWIFYKFDLLIELMMCVPLSISLYFVNIITKDILEGNYKNTYYSTLVKSSFCYKDTKANYAATIFISLAIVILMLLIVQK